MFLIGPFRNNTLTGVHALNLSSSAVAPSNSLDIWKGGSRSRNLPRALVAIAVAVRQVVEEPSKGLILAKGRNRRSKG